MIIDKIENASLYTNLSDRLAKALETLKKENFAEKEKSFVQKPDIELSQRYTFKIDSQRIYFYGICKECQ